MLQLNQSASSERTKHLAAFAGGDDELTILGLDSEGADVNTTSSTRVDYTIGGLPPRASFSLLLWNKSGNGQIVRDSTVTANADGVAQDIDGVLRIRVKLVLVGVAGDVEISVPF